MLCSFLLSLIPKGYFLILFTAKKRNQRRFDTFVLIQKVSKKSSLLAIVFVSNTKFPLLFKTLYRA